MHFLRPLALFTSVLGSLVTAEYTVEQGMYDVQALTRTIFDAKRALEGYDGGLLGGIPMVSLVYQGQQQAVAMRANIRTMSNFTTEQKQDGRSHIADLLQMFGESIDVGVNKVPVIKGSGFAFLGQAFVLMLREEKDQLIAALESKCDAEDRQQFDADLQNLDQKFNRMISALGEV